MYFTWTDDLNTGIRDIDAQHRRIVEYINAVHDAHENGDRSKLGEVMEELLDYTVNHFLFEEQLMQRAGYEFFAAHERVHELFGRRVAEYRGRYAKGEDIAKEVLAMLKSWLANHIRQEDRGYIASVKPLIDNSAERSWVSGLMGKLFGSRRT